MVILLPVENISFWLTGLSTTSHDRWKELKSNDWQRITGKASVNKLMGQAKCFLTELWFG